MRPPNGLYSEYHTSADDLSLVQPDALEHSRNTLSSVCTELEVDSTKIFINTAPNWEPRLGKHGLCHPFGPRPDAQEMQEVILWSLNLSAGRHSLTDIADRSGLSEELTSEAASLLEEHGFLLPLFGDEAQTPGHTPATPSVCATHSDQRNRQ